MKLFPSALVILFVLSSCYSQPSIKQYLGGWSGELSAADAFVFSVQLYQTTTDVFTITFRGRNKAISLPFIKQSDGTLMAKHEEQLTVHLNAKGEQPLAFIETGNHLTYLDLQPSGNDQWSANWNLFTSNNFDPTFYLSLDQLGGNAFGASTFFQSPVMHYMMGENFVVAKDQIGFRDARSGINFTGQLKDNQIDLTMSFLLEQMNFPLYPANYTEWTIGQPEVVAGSTCSWFPNMILLW